MKKYLIYLVVAAFWFSPALTAQTLPPQFSTEGNEVWYYIVFKSSGRVIEDMGESENLKTKRIDAGKVAQLWKLVGNDTAAVLVSKAGRKVYFASSRYKASSSQTPANFNTVVNAGKAGLELRDTAQNKGINQNGGGDANTERELGAYDNNDDNNILSFVEASAYPLISTASDEHWYYLYFPRYDQTLTVAGEGAKVTVVAPEWPVAPAQLWKVVAAEVEGQFTLQNKNGEFLFYSSSDKRFYTASQNTNPPTLVLIGAFTGSYTNTNDVLYNVLREPAKTLVLKLVSDNSAHLNVMRSDSPRTLSIYATAGDDGNAIRFLSPEEVCWKGYPKSSTEEEAHWYSIKSPRAGLDSALRVVEGDSLLKFTTPVEGDGAFLWRFTELPNGGGYAISSKDGKVIAGVAERPDSAAVSRKVVYATTGSPAADGAVGIQRSVAAGIGYQLYFKELTSSNYFNVYANYAPFVNCMGVYSARDIGNHLAFEYKGSSDIMPPTTPKSITLNGIGKNVADLSWGASTDNAGLAGYYVYVYRSDATPPAQPTLTVTATSCTVQNLDVETGYIVDVVAFDVSGNKSGKVTMSFTTKPATALDVPVAALGAVTDSAVELTWAAISGATGYRVYVNGDFSHETAEVADTVTGLTEGTAYTFAVAAYSDADTSPSIPMAAVTTDHNPPAVPSGFALAEATPTTLTLTWSPSAYTGAGVKGYYLYDGSNILVDSTADTAYTFTGLMPSSTYSVKVAAYDSALNVSEMSAEQSGTTLARYASAYPAVQEENFNSPTYYNLYSHRALKVLKNSGDSTIITSVPLAQSGDTTLWRFVRTGAHPTDEALDTFKIVSQVGGGELRYPYYFPAENGKGTYQYFPVQDSFASRIDSSGNYFRADRFYTAKAGNGHTFVFRKFKEDDSCKTFQLWSVQEKRFINMTNNTNDYQTVAYGTDGDVGNRFSAISTADEVDAILRSDLYAGLPELNSTNSYQIQVANNKMVTVFSDTVKSAARILKDGSAKDRQLFTLSGNSYLSFKLVAFDGRELKTGVGDTLTLAASGSGEDFALGLSNEGYWQLRASGNGKGVRESGNAIAATALSEQNIKFIPKSYDFYADMDAPKLSSADGATEYWYYINGSRANRVLAAVVPANETQPYTQQQGVAANGAPDVQLFKLVGAYYDSIKIVAKVGGALKYIDPAIGECMFALDATGADAGDYFALEPNSNTKYAEKGGIWGIRHLPRNTGFHMGHNSSSVITYSISDDGSVFSFSKPLRFKASVNREDAGSIETSNPYGIYPEGFQLILTAVPAPMHKFVRWTREDEGTVSTASTAIRFVNILAADDTTLVANFAGVDATLKSLTVTGARIKPAFSAENTEYAAFVPYDVASVNIAAEVGSPYATLSGNGDVQAPAAGSATLYSLVVTAEDGTTVKTYSLNILRAVANADSSTDIESITVSAGTLEPTFATNVYEYAVSVPNDVDTVTLQAAKSAGCELLSDSVAGRRLTVGANVVTFEALAADYATIKTYTVTVTRAASADAVLSGISVDGYDLTPAFAPEQPTYTLSVPYSVTAITLTATPRHPNATASIGGASQSSLTIGDNEFTITVLAEDGATAKVYTLTVTRAANSDNFLSHLSVEGYAFTSTFAPGVEKYTVSGTLPENVTTIRIVATPRSDGATVVGGGDQPLSVGKNELHVAVTAANGATKTYTITVNRAGATSVSAVALGSLTIYPNPVANGALTIANGNLKAGERIEVYSLSSTLVAAYEVAAGPETVINISQLPQGIYIVKAGAYAAKLVVK